MSAIAETPETFDRSRLDLGLGCRVAGGAAVVVVALASEDLRVGELDDRELALGALTGADGAILVDSDVGIGAVEGDRSRRAQHGVAGKIDQRAVAVDLQ